MRVKWKNYGLLIGLFLLIIITRISYKIKQSYNKNTTTINQSTNKLCPNCNILLIDLDILRADALPCYGHFRNTTPNICEFAKKSVVFEDNYSTSYWTLPSMFSTITSLPPTLHRVRTPYLDSLNSEIPTLAETLHKNGYHTVLSGMSNNENLLITRNKGIRGYDIFINNTTITDTISELSKNSQPWFIHYYRDDLHLPYLLSKNDKPIEILPAPKNLPITHFDFSKLLNKYLKQNYRDIFKKTAIDKYRSIILSPNKPNDTKLAVLFDQIRLSEPENNLFDAWQPVYNTYLNSFDHQNKSDIAYVRMVYDTKIKLLDADIQKILQQISSEPFANNTIVVIMSDHGEEFGEHGGFNHEGNNYHSELFHTPLIIHIPKISGKTISQTSSNMDVFPTLLDLTKIATVSGLQGKSLIKYITDQDSDIDKEYYSLGENDDGYIIQNKKWLFFLPMRSGINQSILHDKIADPLEQNNVAAQYPELVKSFYQQTHLLQSYDHALHSTEKPATESSEINPEKLERLKREKYF